MACLNPCKLMVGGPGRLEDVLANAAYALTSQVYGRDFGGPLDLEKVKAALGGIPAETLIFYLADQLNLRLEILGLLGEGLDCPWARERYPECLDIHPDLLPALVASAKAYDTAGALSRFL